MPTLQKRLTTIFFLIPIISLLSPPSLVKAQSAALSISPPVIEVLLAPNKKIVHAFQITNQGESSNFVANIHAVTPSGNAGHSTVSPAPIDESSIPLVISLANADRKLGEPFSVGSNESTQLVVEIEGANSDITLDSYLALVIKKATSPTQIENSSSSLPAISALILVTLSPDGIIPLNLTLAEFDPPLIHDSALPLVIDAKLTNSANVMLRPITTLQLDSPRHTRSDEIDLDQNLILADSSRTLTLDSGPVAYHPKWYYLGPYQFTIKVTTQGGSQITEVTKTIWLLPIRALITTILLALGITYLIIIVRKTKLSNSTSINK